MSNTASDTTPFSTQKDKTVKISQANVGDAQAQQMKQHFANVFGGKNAPFFAKAAVTNEQPAVDWENFEKMFKKPSVYVPAGKSVPTKYTKSTYNFINSRVENAALGNKGPVTFNKKQEVFKEGSKKTDINISGGDFPQANIGGEATFNNKDSTITAGGGPGTALSTGFIDISKVPHPFSPEEYLAKLLQTGVSSEELVSLLEKNYSVVDLSYSLPSSDKKRAALVETLLKVADME